MNSFLRNYRQKEIEYRKQLLNLVIFSSTLNINRESRRKMTPLTRHFENNLICTTDPCCRKLESEIHFHTEIKNLNKKS